VETHSIYGAITSKKDVAAKATVTFKKTIKKIGIAKLMRFSWGRRTLGRICRRESLDNSTLQEYETLIRQYRLKYRTI
jgi:hypothetical protein